MVLSNHTCPSNSWKCVATSQKQTYYSKTSTSEQPNRSSKDNEMAPMTGWGHPPPTPPPLFIGLWASLSGLQGRESASGKVAGTIVGFCFGFFYLGKHSIVINWSKTKKSWESWGQNGNIWGSILVPRNERKSWNHEFSVFGKVNPAQSLHKSIRMLSPTPPEYPKPSKTIKHNLKTPYCPKTNAFHDFPDFPVFPKRANKDPLKNL